MNISARMSLLILAVSYLVPLLFPVKNGNTFVWTTHYVMSASFQDNVPSNLFHGTPQVIIYKTSIVVAVDVYGHGKT